MQSLNYPRLLILGATGKSGKHLTRLALDNGYQVSVFVRDKQKLNGLSHPQLTVYEGSFEDKSTLTSIFEQGVDGILSTLGMYHRTTDTPLADITQQCLNAIPETKKPQKFVCMSSLGAHESHGQGTFLVRMIQRFNLQYVLLDKNKQEELIKASGIPWVFLRPAQLLRKDISKPSLLWEGDDIPQKVKWKISHLDSAKLMLDLLEDETKTGRAFQCSY